MAKTRSTKKMRSLRARKTRRSDLEQNESLVANNIQDIAVLQNGRTAGPPMPGRISPELVGSLGQYKGNNHILRVLPTLQMKKAEANPISTPLGTETKPNKDGSVTQVINGSTVTIRPDGRTAAKDKSNKAETSINIARYKFPTATIKNGKVIEIKGETIPKHSFTIRTIYGPNTTAQSKSGYGRGTTKEDINAGNTSLGFHEGNHGLDFINYLASNPLPKFEGKVGMSKRAYQVAMDTYTAAIDAYMHQMDNVSETKTDCVGEKADFCIEKSTEE